MRQRPKAEVRQRVDELLATCRAVGLLRPLSLPALGGPAPAGGARPRPRLQPQVLLLDEPFGALDANVRADLRRWLRRLHDDLQLTTLFVTHDQEEAMEVADQVVILRSGRIEQIGPAREVYRHPANDWVMGFLGPVSRIGESLVRPHDLSLSLEPDGDGAVEAMVSRVVHLGSQVRVELELAGGGGGSRPADAHRSRCARARARRHRLRQARERPRAQRMTQASGSSASLSIERRQLAGGDVGER